MNIVNDFLDILQNIETAITAAFKEHPEIGDKDVILATERLIAAYTREKKKLPVLPVKLPANSVPVYKAMEAVCELRLTRESNDVVEDEVAGYKIPVRIMIICLEKLHKSQLRWHKENGFKGYLNVIKEYTS